MSGPGDRERQREEMVSKQIAARGVRSPAVLEAMRTVRRQGLVRTVLPRRCDELVWLDRTRAVAALGALTAEGVPDTCPFGP